MVSKPQSLQLLARVELSLGRRVKESQALGILSEWVKNFTTLAPLVVLVGYDVKHAVSLLFITVKPDLSEAHVVLQLFKAISQQKLAVEAIVRNNLSVRIGLDNCIW